MPILVKTRVHTNKIVDIAYVIGFSSKTNNQNKA